MSSSGPRMPSAAPLLVPLVVVLLLSLLVTAEVGAAAPAGAGASREGGCSRGYLALTLDDGPVPGTTQKFVRVLRSHRVPATFFMRGDRVDKHPELARAVARAGFEIGNHTYDHRHLLRLSPRQVAREIDRTDAALRRAGVHPTRLFRPPFGQRDAALTRQVGSMGYAMTQWTVSGSDFHARSRTQVVQQTMAGLRRAQVRSSNILLLHDGSPSSRLTLAALPTIITGAKRMGYCFGHVRKGGSRFDLAVAGP